MRWYDKHEDLACYLEGFRELETKKRDKLVQGALAIVQREQPGLLSWENTMEFPLEMYRRRWYDNDPDLWLLINGLEGASEETIMRVNKFLSLEFPKNFVNVTLAHRHKNAA